jgi:hypothetical protein
VTVEFLAGSLAGHRHRAIPRLSCVRPFFGPVAQPQTPEAHGNVCVVSTCRCGATRLTNENGGRQERGPWTSYVQMGGATYVVRDGEATRLT